MDSATGHPRTYVRGYGNRIPISIEIGLGWENVKDAYNLPPAYIALMQKGKVRISIDCGGTSFTVVRAPKTR